MSNAILASMNIENNVRNLKSERLCKSPEEYYGVRGKEKYLTNCRTEGSGTSAERAGA